MADKDKNTTSEWHIDLTTTATPTALRAKECVYLPFVISGGSDDSEPAQVVVSAIASRASKDAGLVVRVLSHGKCRRREDADLYDGELVVLNTGEDCIQIAPGDLILNSLIDEIRFALPYPTEWTPAAAPDPSSHEEGGGEKETPTRIVMPQPAVHTTAPNKERPAPPPSPAARAWKWALGVGTATVAIVVLASWFFQVTWETTIVVTLAALAAIWGVNALWQRVNLLKRVNLTGNHVAGLTAVAVFILMCVGGITLLTAPSETTEEEATAPTSDTTDTTPVDTTDTVEETPAVENASPPPNTVPEPAPVPPAPATVTGAATAPPAPVAPAATPPAPKPAAPPAEKPSGPPTHLEDASGCKEKHFLRPEKFPAGKGKWGVVCDDNVYVIGSTVDGADKWVHKDLTLLPGAKPPQ